ncbi:gamma carbonic anhydrase family protein [Caldalkalibacillus salinus]|uniref:gamma carbonic anhydrase family protein n=1 Tax=Caldalkalibacillus salinus TaxID=2803787 RepID=UPI0019245733|nr:gamma carbonic anhydrase family protein [Caldalkalibacillus salinus]
MIYKLNGKKPTLHDSVYIAPGARVIGDVHIGKDSGVWFNAVLRGDEGPIRIGERTNIQDNTTCHLYEGYPLEIENDVTVGHNVILHGCKIKSGSLIGMGATILDGVTIGEKCFIAANTLIPPGKHIPDYSFVMGSPGKVVRECTEEDLEILRMSSDTYVENAKTFKANGITE